MFAYSFGKNCWLLGRVVRSNKVMRERALLMRLEEVSVGNVEFSITESVGIYLVFWPLLIARCLRGFSFGLTHSLCVY